MNMSPLGTTQQTFSKVVRGFEEEEVNQFIAELAEEHRPLLQQHKELVLAVMELEDKLEFYEQKEDLLASISCDAKEVAQDHLAHAHELSRVRIQEAEEKAQAILQASFQQYRDALLEQEKIQKEVHLYKTRLRLMLQARLQSSTEKREETV